MAFGRRKQDQDHGAAEVAAVVEEIEVVEETEAAVEYAAVVADDAGPFDIEDFDDPEQAALARLDLGSVLIPMPPGGQIQVEFDQSGVPTAIWVVTANGRFTIAAYAAPKSPGLWREVAGELAEALRKDGAAASIEDGPWGREVLGIGAGAVRFIGVDGYRWMIRCVVNSMPEAMPALVAEARQALADTVVRRGETPLPVRTPLPVQLPEELAAQLRLAAAQQAQQQMLAAQQQAILAAQQQAHMQMQQMPDNQIDPSGGAMHQVRSTSTGG